MDMNDFRSLSTVLVAIAFAGVCWWAFAPSRRKRFEEDAKLPFADDEVEAQQQKLHPKHDEDKAE